MPRNTLPENYPDEILVELRRLERRHLPLTFRPRPHRVLLQDLLRRGGGRFFVAHEKRRKVVPIGQLLRELRQATALPTNDSAWGRRRIFWDHAELPFLLEMVPGGWRVVDDNCEPLAPSRRAVEEKREGPHLVTLEGRLAA